MRRQNASQTPPQGPYRAEQLRSGDPYELSNGYRIARVPKGGACAGLKGLGFLVTSSDPLVQETGVDAGYSPEPGMLRSPDVAVGNVPDQPGWIKGAPALAIEYADVGQDEGELAAKISDLLGAGTRFLWVVRLTGPRRVEVYEPDKAIVTVLPGKHLVAPGVLRNPVLVEALYERGAAQRAALTNLLQRAGYADLEAVRAKGREEGRLFEARAALRRVLARRKLAFGAEDEAKIEACSDRETVARWMEEAIDAKSAAEALR